MTKRYRQYTVRVTVTVPIAGRSNEPCEMDFSALTGADAIKQARTYMTNTVGHDSKTDGPLKYAARLSSAIRGLDLSRCTY